MIKKYTYICASCGLEVGRNTNREPFKKAHPFEGRPKTKKTCHGTFYRQYQVPFFPEMKGLR